jgi:hypothetical protein
VTRHFGPENPPPNPSYEPGNAASPAYVIGDETSNCDFNKNGTIDFSDPKEKSCSDACALDVECTEWSNFASRTNFFVVLKDSYKNDKNQDVSPQVKIQADGSTSPGFTPLPFRGKVIQSITGTLGYFSGGNQFTIEARCSDDVVTDPTKKPKPSSEACVFPRSEGQLEPE